MRPRDPRGLVRLSTRSRAKAATERSIGTIASAHASTTRRRSNRAATSRSPRNRNAGRTQVDGDSAHDEIDALRAGSDLLLQPAEHVAKDTAGTILGHDAPARFLADEDDQSPPAKRAAPRATLVQSLRTAASSAPRPRAGSRCAPPIRSASHVPSESTSNTPASANSSRLRTGRVRDRKPFRRRSIAARGEAGGARGARSTRDRRIDGGRCDVGDPAAASFASCSANRLFPDRTGPVMSTRFAFIRTRGDAS